jgi:ABC-type enterochelin transport system permease subunit
VRTERKIGVRRRRRGSRVRRILTKVLRGESLSLCCFVMRLER